MSQLSVVVPCFNEVETIIELLEKVIEQPCVGQVVVVDDGSTEWFRENVYFFALIYISLIYLLGDLRESIRNREAVSIGK